MTQQKANPGAGRQPGRNSLLGSNLILPQAENSEISILGSIIQEGKLIKKTADLSANDFYKEKHQTIFSIMKDLKLRDVPIDISILHEEIRKAGKEEITGGFNYLGYLVEITPSTANFDYHFKAMREASHNRKLWEKAERLKQAIQNGANEEVISELQSQVSREEPSYEPRLKPISAKNLPDTQQVESLWAELLYPSCITQVNSEPGVGKTTLFYNLCLYGSLDLPFLDIRFSKILKVLYVDLETLVWLRKKKLETIYPKELPENLYFLDSLSLKRDFSHLLTLCCREK